MKVVRSFDSSIVAKLNEPVQNLHHKLYPEIFKPFNSEAVKAYFETAMQDGEAYFYICIEADQTIGYIWFLIVEGNGSAFSYPKRYIYINQISVNEEHRGRGAGKLLFNAAVEIAKAKDIDKIGLDYWCRNEDAKAIYRSYGFEVEREIAFIYI